MGEQYGLPTLILAAAAVVISAVSLMSLFVFRYRDRIELQVTGMKLEGDSFIVTFRNRGGTPAHMKGVYFNGGGAWINLGLDPLAGRSEGRIGVEIAVAADRTGGSVSRCTSWMPQVAARRT